MEKFISIGKAAKILGVTPLTLRRWEKAKVIASERTPHGHRRYRADDVMRLFTGRQAGFGTRCVIYARVSRRSSHRMAIWTASGIGSLKRLKSGDTIPC